MEEFKGIQMQECLQASEKVKNQIWEKWSKYFLWTFHLYFFWHIFSFFSLSLTLQTAFLSFYLHVTVPDTDWPVLDSSIIS